MMRYVVTTVMGETFGYDELPCDALDKDEWTIIDTQKYLVWNYVAGQWNLIYLKQE